MKISEMDKAELVQYMRNVTRELIPNDRFRYDSEAHTWKRAFDLIRKDGYENLEMDCNKCIDKVYRWLIK